MRVTHPELGAEEARRLRDDSLRILAGDGTPADEMHDVLDRHVRRVLETARPAGAYTTHPVLDVLSSGVLTEPGLLASPMFARLVGRCDGPVSLVFRVVTIGEPFHEDISRTGPLYERFVMDAVGSALVEIVADLVEEEGREELSARGLECSLRVSPGYCDWPVEGQVLVFNAVDTEEIGVTINDRCVMAPLKSHSSVSVVANRVPFTSSCAFCYAADCGWRRIPAVRE